MKDFLIKAEGAWLVVGLSKCHRQWAYLVKTAFSFLHILRTIQREYPVHLAQGLCDHLSPRDWSSQGGPCELLNWTAGGSSHGNLPSCLCDHRQVTHLSMLWLPHLKGSGGQTPAVGNERFMPDSASERHTVSFRQCVLSALRQFHC